MSATPMHDAFRHLYDPPTNQGTPMSENVKNTAADASADAPYNTKAGEKTSTVYHINEPVKLRYVIRDAVVSGVITGVLVGGIAYLIRRVGESE
jgi:hypothetical protein